MATSREDARPLQRCGWRANGRLRYPATYTTSWDATAGHDVAVLNPLVARRFQDVSLERTKTDAIDAQGLARLAFEKRPAPSRLHDGATEALRE